MLSGYQKMLLEDLSGPQSYGRPVAGWKGQVESFRDAQAPPNLQALSPDLALTFIEQTYLLLCIQRVVKVYRGFETAGLRAPYGLEHPSFIRGLVQSRHPGKPDGLWWTPARPSKSIDDLRLSDMHRAEDRAASAIKLAWNRIDYYIEADLLPGAFVYAGRAAPQWESAVYGGGRYGGGAMQFRLTMPPELAFRWMKRYVSS